MSPKKSTKVLKERHPITCNLSDSQYREVQAAIVALRRRTGLELKPGTYATHALLSYPKQRLALEQLKGMIAEAGATGMGSLDIASIKNALSAVLA